MKNKDFTIRITNDVNEATIITHSGVFHADDVLATVILALFYGAVQVLRTFKVPDNVVNKVVYDIGGGDFDHHQKGGNGCRENGVPFAAAGLIWLEFGKTVCHHTPDPQWVWETIDRELIQGIDAIDNGVYPGTDYPCHAMSVSGVISGFNPTWDSEESSDDAFLKACNFAAQIFENVFDDCVSKARAKKDVEEAIEKSENHIMILDKYMPWQEYVFESDNQKAEEIWYVVFPSSRGGYNWQCVPDAPGSFGQRHPVPDSWKGLRDSDLQVATGVVDAVFCHPAGFIGGAETLEGALAIAKEAALW